MGAISGDSFANAFFGKVALAQIAPDITLPVNSVVTPDGNMTVITGGTPVDSNLFHSFQEFSVPNGGTAYFNNPLNIQNIFSRVTGGSISQIDGLIRANGTANLFLLNPNGIIFGPNARLDIRGSFLASTASGLVFADGTFFSAKASQTPPPLTISVPIGLQFGSNPGSILVQGPGHNFSLNGDEIQRADSPLGLTIQPGRTLALVGGEVKLDGGTLQAPASRIELGGLAGAGTVELNRDGSLSFPASALQADISITNRSRIDVRTGGDGSISINARNLEVSGGSILSAGIAENLGSLSAQAGNIEINATGEVTITGISPSPREFFSVFTNDVGVGAIGNGGEINITAGSLSVANGALLIASTRGQGNAGNINIDVRDTVAFSGQRPFVRTNTDIYSSAARSRVEPTAVGQGSSINITTGSLFVTNGAVLTATTLGQGNAGRIVINARDTVAFDGEGPNQFSSGAFSRVRGGAVGQGGSIDITARSISVTNGALITTSTNGQGDGGNIRVNASDSVTLSGFGPYDGFSSGLYTQTERGAFGQGGNIIVNATALYVQNGAVIDAETVRDTNGGSVTINANRFEGTNGGQVFTTTRGGGKAGNITINATESVILSSTDPTFADRIANFGRDNVPNEGSASGLFASTALDSTGAGGNLTIQTGQLIVRDEAQVTVSANGLGAAGDLNITADLIELDNGALRAETQAGNFGNIQVRSQNLILRRGSTITTDATQGTATGGNITINTDVLAALEGSDIIARAVEGRGGNIQINTQGIFQSSNSNIDASSRQGINGVVEISTPDVDPSQGIIKLPEEIVDVSRLIAQGCPADKGNTFTVTGGGGLPPNPSQPLRSSALAVNWVTLPSRNASILPTSTAEKPRQDRLTTNPIAATAIVEAQGWMLNAKGEVVLTAAPPTTSPSHLQSFPTSCQK